MSYKMYSEDCYGIKVDDTFATLLKKDVINFLSDEEWRKKLLSKSVEQYDILKGIADSFSEEYDKKEITELSNDDFLTFLQEIYDYDLRYLNYSENNAIITKVNLDTGEIDVKNQRAYDGYVWATAYPLNVNLYKPLFSKKEELFNDAKAEFYIPEEFDIENNFYYFTGVSWG